MGALSVVRTPTLPWLSCFPSGHHRLGHLWTDMFGRSSHTHARERERERAPYGYTRKVLELQNAADYNDCHCLWKHLLLVSSDHSLQYGEEDARPEKGRNKPMSLSPLNEQKHHWQKRKWWSYCYGRITAKDCSNSRQLMMAKNCKFLHQPLRIPLD